MKTLTACLFFLVLLGQSSAQLTAEEEAAEEQLVLRIREHVLAGNFFELNKILSNVTNTTTVARGFRYPPGEADIYTRVTPNRVGDPDVNTLFGLVESLRFGGANANQTAEIFTTVLFLQGPDFAPDPATTFMGFFESFNNATELDRILSADPAEIFAEENVAEGRKLLVAKGTPADTPLCSSCFEKAFCKKNAPWC